MYSRSNILGYLLLELSVATISAFKVIAILTPVSSKQLFRCVKVFLYVFTTNQSTFLRWHERVVVLSLKLIQIWLTYKLTLLNIDIYQNKFHYVAVLICSAPILSSFHPKPWPPYCGSLPKLIILCLSNSSLLFSAFYNLHLANSIYFQINRFDQNILIS